MKSQIWNGLAFMSLLVGVLSMAAGCGSGRPSGQSGSPAPNAAADAGHDLDGWWCSEHGLPEEECSLCSTEFAEQSKGKGDWCKEHNRAESQCFICHPELEAKFAARYEAKFGKKPPKRAE